MMLKMVEIFNPWEGMEGYNCFGCSSQNPIGAHMRFFDTNPGERLGYIFSAWQPTQNHQSWINTLHGGMQATLLDEVCGWVVFAKLKTSGVTAKMEIKYKRPVSTINGPLLLKAELISLKHRVAVVEGQIWCKRTEPRKPEVLDMLVPPSELALPEPIGEDYECFAVCECTYFTYNDEKAQQMGYREPAYGTEELTLADLIEGKKFVTYRQI